MKRTRIIIAVLVSVAFLIPAAAQAADVDKCFKKVDKATAKITKYLSGWSMAKYAKNSKKLGDLLDKSWRATAKCLDKRYKPKSGQKPLKSALMRGKRAYNDTNGEKWMGQGLINRCIPMAIDAYQGTESVMDSEKFKSLSKKQQKKEKKNLLKNQAKEIRGTVGYCFKKENSRYKKRLEDYLDDHYQKK